MTSETILGLNPPVEHMCPTIDTYVQQSKELVKDVNKLRQCSDLDEVDSVYKDLDWYVEDFEGHFEECRSACEGIREWGDCWKKIAKELLHTHYPEWENEDSKDHEKVVEIMEGLF